MNRTIFALLVSVIALRAFPAHAQAAPAATASSSSLSVGGEGSVFQPDFAGGTSAQTSPNRLYGIGGFADMKFTRWIQVEGEARFLHFNEYLGINENTYQIGPRIPIITVKRFTPYGKVLFGLGNGSVVTSNSFVLTYGGGVDYRLNRKFTLRAIDFEYQRWSVSPSPLYPYGGSVGLSYKIF